MYCLMNRKKIITGLVCMMAGAVFVYFMSCYVDIAAECRGITEDIIKSELFRSVDFPYDDYRMLYYYSTDEQGIRQLEGVNSSRLKGIVYDNIYNVLKQQKLKNVHCPVMFRYMVPDKIFKDCFSIYFGITNDIRCFPVSYDSVNNVGISYVDSWGAARSYGGDRVHEGTDIMAGNNERGYFPVVSMTDGKVEKLGWLELGGYRVGIRSASGAYYYYAHLDSYADGLKEGMDIKAGSVIGTMGDSGYGDEGTKGKFDVHLHLGIYYGEDEISFNPYHILKVIDGFRMEFQKY